MTRLFLMLALVAAILSSTVDAADNGQNRRIAAQNSGFDKARLGRLDAHAKALVDAKMLPGITYLIHRFNREVHYGEAGQRDIAGNKPINRDTIFRIYSMTKPITGVAMMMLYEEGRFLLDDPVENYIPEFKDMPVFIGMNEDGSFKTEPQKRKMTMADLMSHTAGFTYGLFSNTPVDKLLRDGLKPGMTNQDMINLLAGLPLLFQPGSRWHYSLSVDIQGYLIEKLSGMPLDQFFQQRIFAPLGMEDTSFFVPSDKANRLIKLYSYDKQGQLVEVPQDSPFRIHSNDNERPSWLSGGGGLFSTIDDYMKFSQMLLNKGQLNRTGAPKTRTRLLSPTSVDFMTRNHVSADALEKGGLAARGLGFGLNFAVMQDPTKAGSFAVEGAYNWGGAASTIFWIDPKHDIAVVAMTSALTGTSDILRKRLRAAVYQALTDSR